MSETRPARVPKQALRLRRFMLAVASYALWVALVIYAYSLGMIRMAPHPFWVAVALTVVVNIIFFLLIITDVNLNFRDPSMTVAKMLNAPFWIMLVLHSAIPELRGALLLLYMITFLFGIFRLRLHQFLWLSLLVLVVYALMDMWPSSGRSWTDLDIIQYFILVVSMLWVSFFGDYVGRLRTTLAARNQALHDAVATIRDLAVHDDLTGVYNRRHIMEVLEQERERCTRTNRVFCLCLLDLDHFKQINDRYGHLVGDAVLQRFAARVSEQIRSLDVVGRPDAAEPFARLGGEEFLLVLPETTLQGAQLCAERIRSAIHRQPLQAGEARVNLTVSIGISEFSPGEEIEHTLARADRALYAAKQAGRNRTESYGFEDT